MNWIDLFNQQHVRYLVIGGQAMRLHGMPRYSMDWDVLIPKKEEDNFNKINQLLEDELDLDLLPLDDQGNNLIQTYQTRWGIIQFHLAIPGVSSFDEVFSRKVWIKDDNVEVAVIAGKDLLKAKQHSNRPQEQLDIEFLLAKEQAGTL